MDFGNPSFIGKRQQHLYSTAETSLSFSPNAESEKAGLVIFQDESHFYYLCKSKSKDKAVIQLYKSIAKEKSMELLAEIPVNASPKPVGLRISSAGDTYSFYFSEDFKNWKPLKEKVDGKFLSTKEAGGFIDCLYGMYATSSGEKSTNSASFKYLKYKGDDPMFK